MSNLSEIKEELRKLSNENTDDRSTISKIRELLPYIEEAKNSGVQYKKIVEVLNNKGIKVTIKSLSVILTNLRKANNSSKSKIKKDYKIEEKKLDDEIISSENDDENLKNEISNTSLKLVSPFISPKIHDQNKRIKDENSDN